MVAVALVNLETACHGLVLADKGVLVLNQLLACIVGVLMLLLLRAREDVGGVRLYDLLTPIVCKVLVRALGLALLRLGHEQLVLLVLGEVDLSTALLVSKADRVVLRWVLAALGRVDYALLFLL